MTQKQHSENSASTPSGVRAAPAAALVQGHTPNVTTHRVIQLSNLLDIASTNRVRYYINAQRASWLGNHGAAVHFTRLAFRWEQLRQHASRRLFKA